MDVLPTRPPETVEQMLPLALKYFAESLCYNSEDISSWLQIVKGAMKLGRGRLLRFALESILYESLKRTDFIQDAVSWEEDIPVLPPVAYRAVEGLLKILPQGRDTFSYDVQLSHEIAHSVGMIETPPQYLVNPNQELECDHLRVEADNWFRLGKCLLNAFSKLDPDHLVGATVRIVPHKKDRQSSTHSHTSQLAIANITTTSTTTDDVEEIPPPSATESRSAKRRRSTSEMEVDSKRRLSKRVRALEESTTETENTRTQEFIQTLNSLLRPLNLTFGDYSTMEFFRAGTETHTDKALDVWKNFLWEWTTERALPFETTYKQKSTAHVADTLLFERAAGTAGMARTSDPDRVANGSFEEFGKEVEEEGLHLGQTAARWLEVLLVSREASYRTERWATEFLDVVTSVTIMYEDVLLDRVKALFTDGSFMTGEKVPTQEIEVLRVCGCILTIVCARGVRVDRQ